MSGIEKQDANRTVNPHAGHRERMRERFAETGLAGFADHEILEFLLFYVNAQKNTNDLGHALIDRFGSLKGVLNAEYGELLQVRGIGERSAMLIKLLPEIFRKYSTSDAINTPMKKCEDRCGYFLRALDSRTEEIVLLACLNDQWKLQSVFEIARGIPDRVEINPQRLLRVALASGCTNFILAHNHPMGLPVASFEDINVTETLCKLMKKVQLYLVDHIIVADKRSVSMLDCGFNFN